MIIMTPELAEICGIHAGDGYLRARDGKNELDISGNIEEQEYYDNYVIPLFNNLFNLSIKGRNFSRGTYGFVLYNKKIGSLFHEIGFPYGEKSKIVKTPSLIIDSNNLIFYANFIRGLFDTDGHLGFRKFYGNNYKEFKIKYHNYPRIQLTTISYDLAREICFMLDKLEIKNILTSYQPKRLNENKRYIVIINGVERLEKWMDIIGTKNYSKLSRYLIWKKFGFCPTNISLKQREDIINDKLDIYSLGPVI